MTTIPGLIPATARPPVWCRCGKPVPRGVLVDGWGPVCAAKRGLTPPGSVRLRVPSIAHVAAQAGPDLFDTKDDTWAREALQNPTTGDTP